MIVSLSNSLLEKKKTGEREKKERKANCQGHKKCCCRHFKSIKKTNKSKKFNSHIFCLVEFYFPIHGCVVAVSQRLAYL